MFGAVCLTDMRRGILAFTVFGAVRGVQIGAFSGEEMTQGLLPVELLASILIGAWLFKNGSGALSVRRTQFNLPLISLVPCSLISLVVGFTFYDSHDSALSHEARRVLRPGSAAALVIGIYLVVANTTYDLKTVDAIRTCIVVLATPSVALLVSLRAWPYVEWDTTFALPRHPCALRSSSTRRVR